MKFVNNCKTDHERKTRTVTTNELTNGRKNTGFDMYNKVNLRKNTSSLKQIIQLMLTVMFICIIV